MNIYEVLNKITLYIDTNLTNDISYEVIASMLATNIYTMQRIFSVMVGIPIGEYIRKRKLSSSAYDLVIENMKVIDVAVKYSYESAASFSRAFEAFHGVSPRDAKKERIFKEFPRVIYEEKEMPLFDLDYEIVDLPELKLYEISIKTDNKSIKHDAPEFVLKYRNLYEDEIKYGMVSYADKERSMCNKYSILYEKEQKNSKPLTIPEHRWLKYSIKTNDAKDIQKMSDDFYKHILPSLKYTLSDIPELEYYHDNQTDFMVPIEKNGITN